MTVIESPTEKMQERDVHSECHLYLVAPMTLCGRVGVPAIHREDAGERNGCCDWCGRRRCPECADLR